MAIECTYRTVCDRCGETVKDVSVGSDDEVDPVVVIEAVDLGYPLKMIRHACDKCKKELKSLLGQVVFCSRKSKKK